MIAPKTLVNMTRPRLVLDRGVDLTIWQGVCIPADADAPCGVYFETDCPAERCEYNSQSFVCEPKGQGTLCSSAFDPTTCKALGSKCTFTEQASVCWPSDVPVPCDKYYASCPDDRCQSVTIVEGGTSCVDKDAPIDCSIFQEQDYCPSPRCAWESTASLCHLADVPLECENFFEV